MWILDPISLTTHGKVGIGPLATGYCPAPLALVTIGYVRFEVAPPVDPFGGGTGHGAIIQEHYPEKPRKNHAKLALLAIIAIEETET